MYIVLSGAKKNIGDFLIVDRLVKLIRHVTGEEVLILDRFKPLDEHLDKINVSKGVILGGGPAYASNIYPGIYPLVDDLEKIKVPIIPFGLGWSGRPENDPKAFRFTDQSLSFLKSVHQRAEFTSCRDVITKSILDDNGFTNSIMTGCPVWYDVQSLGKKLDASSVPGEIVFTTSAEPRLIFQNLKLIKLLRRKFPEANIYMSFHRGIRKDEYTSYRSALVYRLMILLAKRYRVEVRDVSYDLERIKFYDDCDFHLGYRVHAHLYFLSKRKPSILINEDGRGKGMVQTLGLPELNAREPELVKKVDQVIDGYLQEEFNSFNDVFEFIDQHYQTDMLRFINSLPK